jgi:hypothetical protein
MGQGKENPLEATFSLFAMAASYREDVVEGKHEYENLEASALEPSAKEAAHKALNEIANAPQLNPLTKEELAAVTERIRELHGAAYGWNPPTDGALLSGGAERVYLLRTRIRGIVERLDQLYQYGEVGDVTVGELSAGSFEEEAPSLEGWLE